MPADINRRTEYRYNPDGRLVELVAFNESTGEQVTRWEYGTTLAESQVASNGLVRAKVYADDVGGSDRVEYRYNELGELVSMGDQNGTVHTYDYDGLGRLLDDRVTVLGSGVDGAVQRITRSYNARGLLETVISHSSPTAESVLDQIKREYNGYGQLVREYQGHDGSAITTETAHVDYEYESEVENSSRLKKITYPDGREIEYGYGAAESIDDLTDRVATITENEEELVSYSRRGIESTVRIGYEEAGVELTYIKQGSEPVGDGGDRYTGLDRFNRIVDVRWLNSSSGADVDRYQYAFDRASNRTFRHNTTAPTSGGNAGWDEAYSYDGVYQLSELERGIPNSGHTAIETMKWQENFTYDETGAGCCAPLTARRPEFLAPHFLSELFALQAGIPLFHLCVSGCASARTKTPPCNPTTFLLQSVPTL